MQIKKKNPYSPLQKKAINRNYTWGNPCVGLIRHGL